MALAAWLASPALAGGLFVQEFGTPGQGMANAGAGAAARDASTTFHNPAGMTRLDDHQAISTLGVVFADVRFEPSSSNPTSGNNGGHQGGEGPVLFAGYSHKLSERWRAGISVVSLSAAVLDPKNDWAGRYQLQQLGLITLSAFPTVAYRLHDKISVGVGANIMYGWLKYKVAVDLPGPQDGQVEFDGIDDFDAGATVSVLLEPWEHTRIGVVWGQRIDMDLDGDIKFRGGSTGNVDTTIPYAQLVHVSAVHEITPRLWLGASFRWEEWSEFENQFVSFGPVDTAIPRGFQDTWGGALGLVWQANERFRLRTGMGYDSSPVRSVDRIADMPMDEQIRAGIGFEFLQSPTMTWGANFTYVDLGKARINGNTLRGTYSRNQMYAFSFYFLWHRLPWSGRGTLGSGA